MGATNFEQKVKSNSMGEAYKAATTEAREEYGTDPYNGTISTTCGFKDVTSKFKSSGQDIDKFIDENLDNTEKRGACWGVCLKEPEKKNKGEYLFFGWAAC